MAVTGDRRRVAVGANDGLVHVFSLEDGSIQNQLAEMQGPRSGAVRSLAFDPAGTRLVGTTVSGAATVWNLAEGTHVMMAQPAGAGGGAGAMAVATDFAQATFSPDGTQLITVAADGVMTLRDANSLQPTGRRFVGNTSGGSFDLGPFFSRDGRFVMSTADLQARMWDMATGQQIGGTFPFDPDYMSNVSHSGRWLVTGHNGRVLLFDLDMDAWPAVACRAAGRNMTEDEWDRYGPSSPSRATCSQHAAPKPAA
jgi:WD40 repeat protein